MVPPLPSTAPAIRHMRGLAAVLAGIGVATFLVGEALDLAHGDLGSAGWKVVGPLPFLAAGVLLALRRPGWPVGAWLLGVGATFMVSVCVGDAVLPALVGWPGVWSVALLRDLGSTTVILCGLGLVGLLPTGLPERRWERHAIRAMAVAAVLLPVLAAVARPTFIRGVVPDDADPVVVSPFYLPAATPASGPLTAALTAAPLAITVGLVMLYLRYRRGDADTRRRIRWPLVGLTGGLATWAGTSMVAWLFAPGASTTVAFVLWPVCLLLVLGSLLVASGGDGALGIDRPARRALVYRLLWAVIAVAYVASAAVLGVLAARALPIGVAVLLAAGAAVLFQPLQRRLERLADRWVFGDRLDGYGVLARFGTVLESAPEPRELLPTLAETVRQGLGLTWVRVRLDVPADPASTAEATAGTVSGDPALSVPLAHVGRVLGHIDCGSRRDRLLVEEDRRLLAQLAAQAAGAVHERFLGIELAARLDLIARQAEELAASRARVAQARDAERRRIQRDLHDGVQQEVVALAAKLAAARQRLLPHADGADTLDELQGDLHRHLSHVREFAHTIHPPVLADRGLLEAVEAQASRLALPVVIEADPALRGVRYPELVESAAWYVIAEALTNVVKHACAGRVVVAVAEGRGWLVVEVRDDGRGFDPTGPPGLGLAGLADRIDIAGGCLRVRSEPGAGTRVRAELPLPTGTDGGRPGGG